MYCLVLPGMRVTMATPMLRYSTTRVVRSHKVETVCGDAPLDRDFSTPVQYVVSLVRT